MMLENIPAVNEPTLSNMREFSARRRVGILTLLFIRGRMMGDTAKPQFCL